jgi:protein-tyrosine phosphatase
VIDLHAHLLPGLDDGPPTLDGALEIVRSAAADGVTAIAATPHVRDDHPTRAADMERALAEVRAAAADVDIEILPGGEIAHDRLRVLDDDELRRFGVGGNPRLLLIECPYAGWPLDLDAVLFDLAARGFTVLFAHPERNAEVMERPELVSPLVDRGVLVQVTAASVDGRLGRRIRRSAEALLERGLVHVLASDAHVPSIRSAGLTSAVGALGDPALGDWLTRAVPAALLAGEPLPPRPRRRRWPRR